MRMLAHPTTQHLPHPLATNAACEVIPPRVVSIASEANMPCTSSGEVSLRTSITCFPFLCHTSASSAVNTICPEAPPGPAGNPFANNSDCFSTFASNMGCIISPNCSGFTRIKAVFSSIIPSSSISTAMHTDAGPFRFPVRV